MPILKSSPSELAIHGGGAPAFASKVPALAPNVGDGARFASLAERMFLNSDAPGTLVREFEQAVAKYIGVRNAIAFSSSASAVRSLISCFGVHGRIVVPALGSGLFPLQDALFVDADPASHGPDPNQLRACLNSDLDLAFGLHALGRPCAARSLIEASEDAGIPICFFAQDAFGARVAGESVGCLGRAAVFEFGRGEIVHAGGAALVSTGDDLLAHRLRTARAERLDGIDQAMSDANAAMGIANLEALGGFIEANRRRHELYRDLLDPIPGIQFLRHANQGATCQCLTIEIDPAISGITRDALKDVLTAENVQTVRPFEGDLVHAATPVAHRLHATLLRLPNGPDLADEDIEAICRLISLAIVAGMESPDPIRLAA